MIIAPLWRQISFKEVIPGHVSLARPGFGKHHHAKLVGSVCAIIEIENAVMLLVSLSRMISSTTRNALTGSWEADMFDIRSVVPSSRLKPFTHAAFIALGTGPSPPSTLYKPPKREATAHTKMNCFIRCQGSNYSTRAQANAMRDNLRKVLPPPPTVRLQPVTMSTTGYRDRHSSRCFLSNHTCINLETKYEHVRGLMVCS